MAGSPRMMAKRMRQLLERHNKFGGDLDALMPKQYSRRPFRLAGTRGRKNRLQQMPVKTTHRDTVRNEK